MTDALHASTVADAPKVTVLLPVFNADAFLEEAVQSILAQTYTDFELLAINDGSTDRSRDILAGCSDPRLVIVDNEGNRGLIYSLNHGIAIARGEYIARMDSDDIAFPTRFEKQVALLDSRPKVALVGSWAEFVDQAGRRIELREVPVGNESIQARLLEVCCFVHPSVMIRTAVAREFGGYRPDAIHAEDYDLWLRIAEKYEVDNLPEPLLRYRIHPGQVSQRKLQTQRAVADRCRAEAWRRRMASGALPPDTPSPVPGLLSRLRGERNTEGGDYLDWINVYRAMGREDMGAPLLYPLMRAAPLSRQAHRMLWKKAFSHVLTPGQFKALRAYQHRLTRFLARKS